MCAVKPCHIATVGPMLVTFSQAVKWTLNRKSGILIKRYGYQQSIFI